MQSCWTVLWAAYVGAVVIRRAWDLEILGSKEIADFAHLSLFLFLRNNEFPKKNPLIQPNVWGCPSLIAHWKSHIDSVKQGWGLRWGLFKQTSKPKLRGMGDDWWMLEVGGYFPLTACPKLAFSPAMPPAPPVPARRGKGGSCPPD